MKHIGSFRVTLQISEKLSDTSDGSGPQFDNTSERGSRDACGYVHHSSTAWGVYGSEGSWADA